jgi:hypothetical protein
VLAQIIEPTSKQDSLRVLDEAGAAGCRIRRSTSACGPRRKRSGARRYRTFQIRVGQNILTAEDPPRPTSATPSPSSSSPNEVRA